MRVPCSHGHGGQRLATLARAVFFCGGDGHIFASLLTSLLLLQSTNTALSSSRHQIFVSVLGGGDAHVKHLQQLWWHQCSTRLYFLLATFEWLFFMTHVQT